MVINVEIQPGADMIRHDDKKVSPEEAEVMMEHMSEVQRERLRERLNCGSERCNNKQESRTAPPPV